MAPRALTRRRSTDAPEECWHVYYGEIHAGTIAIRSGIPHDEDPWEWHCGFYPGSHPGEHQSGTAATRPGPFRLRSRVGGISWQTEPRLTFGHGAISATGPRANMKCGQLAKSCH